MVKKKEISRLETIIGNLEVSLNLAKEEYAENPSNPLYSVITDIQLTLIELKKIK